MWHDISNEDATWRICMKYQATFPEENKKARKTKIENIVYKIIIWTFNTLWAKSSDNRLVVFLFFQK